MKTAEEIKDLMYSFTGTTAYHEFSPLKSYPVITDGVFAVVEAAECLWFLEIIGHYQGENKKLDPDFQVWKLTKNADGSAVIQGFNDVTLIVTHEIDVTVFPLDELEVWLENGVILLPSEH